MKSLTINDDTYERLSAIRSEIMDHRRCDLSYDDLVNELIDSYRENSWDTNIGIGAGGG
jgi:predicted CopG family antitoxin